MDQPIATPEIVMQRLVDRTHFYSVSAVTAHFVADLGGGELEDFDTKHGTAFMVRTGDDFYFVTNRHVLDYNFGRSKEAVVRSAALKAVHVRGHAQPRDLTQSTIPWTFRGRTTEIAFHPDQVTDIAILNAGWDDYTPCISTDRAFRTAMRAYDASTWLADKADIDLLTPGEEVLIVGYPGLAGGSERPVLVTGTVASDPRYPATFGNAKLNNAVLCHSFSWQGMSGAPVLCFSGAIGQTKIIGINAGHVGGSGITGGVISHFVRSSALVELLDSLPSDTGTNEAPA